MKSTSLGFREGREREGEERGEGEGAAVVGCAEAAVSRAWGKTQLWAPPDRIARWRFPFPCPCCHVPLCSPPVCDVCQGSCSSSAGWCSRWGRGPAGHHDHRREGVRLPPHPRHSPQTRNKAPIPPLPPSRTVPVPGPRSAPSLALFRLHPADPSSQKKSPSGKRSPSPPRRK